MGPVGELAGASPRRRPRRSSSGARAATLALPVLLLALAAAALPRAWCKGEGATPDPVDMEAARPIHIHYRGHHSPSPGAAAHPPPPSPRSHLSDISQWIHRAAHLQPPPPPGAAAAAARLPAPPPPPPPPTAPAAPNGTSSIAQILDRALDKEFAVEKKSDSESAGEKFNETVTTLPAAVETVVRISSHADAAAPPADGAAAAGDAAGGGGGAADAVKPAAGGQGAGGAGNSGSGGGSGAGAGAGGGGGADMAPVEVGVDRIIDSHDNEYVMSAPKSSAVAALMLDPRLVQDLTLMLAAAAVFGALFQAMRQPVINGYLVAGAVVGPGGLQLVKELVQVESLAQVGVQLLLFGLGRELSLSKLRPVLRVALIGGSLQIAALMAIGGAAGAAIGGGVQQGLFVGALLSMSSTSVVVKCLEATRATQSPYGQLTIGTLILQDCSVGLMFALMPAFAHKAHAPPPPTATAAAAAAAAGAAAAAEAAVAGAMMPGGDGGLVAASAAAAGGGADGGARLAVVLLVLRVLLKLSALAAVAYPASRTLLPWLLELLVKRAPRELVQLWTVSFCLSVAWACGRLELSEELGAFAAGAMLSAAERLLVDRGALAPSHALASPMAADDGAAGAGAPAAAAPASTSSDARPPAVADIESISNVLTALFLSSIGLIMSPVFLMHHAGVLLAGTAVVIVVKTAVVAAVVRAFGVPSRTAWAAGLTMAHTGEFSFVLLSMARQLRLLPETLYMLLLGVTATSLLTTPLVILGTHKLLHSAGQYMPVANPAPRQLPPAAGRTPSKGRQSGPGAAASGGAAAANGVGAAAGGASVRADARSAGSASGMRYATELSRLREGGDEV